MAWEITVTQLDYDGNQSIEPRLKDHSDINVIPEWLRLDVYVDGSSLRDPFIIRRSPAELGSVQIGRTWGFDSRIDFELWLVPPSPEDAQIGYDDQQPYDEYQTMLKKATLDSPADMIAWENLGLDEDIKLRFEIVEQPNRTAIESALHDFQSEPDDGLQFVDKSDVYSVAEKFGSRVDQTGVGNSPDGYPDETLEVVDQGSTQYCAGASILVNYGIFQPRMLVELCRSVYQSMSREDDGSRQHGFLTKSISATFDTSELETFINNRSSMPDEQAFIELLLELIRRTLRSLRPILDTLDNGNQASPGMDDPEIAVMISELIEVTGTRVLEKQGFHTDGWTLQQAQEAIDNDNVNVLGLDSSLVAPGQPLSQTPTIDHAIRILDTNVPAINDTGPVPGTVEVDFHATNGGGPLRIRGPRGTLDQYIFSVVVGER